MSQRRRRVQDFRDTEKEDEVQEDFSVTEKEEVQDISVTEMEEVFGLRFHGEGG